MVAKRIGAKSSRQSQPSIAGPRFRLADVLAAFDEPPAPMRKRNLEIPKPPPGVMPDGVKQPQMAMDWAGNIPGYLNNIAGVSQFGLYFPGYPYLSELAQRSEYRQPVETTANELTRKWIILKSKGRGDKTKRIQELTDDIERFRLRALFRQAAIHDGQFGLALMFISLKGHEDHSLPLKLDSAGIEKDSLIGFKLIEPMWATPLVWNSIDPTADYFYRPERWMCLGQETHADRLLTFIARPVPEIIKPAYNFGGISLSQLIQPYVDRWLKTVDGVNRLITNFSILFLQTDMAQQLANAANLKNRIALFQKTRDNQGVFVTDKDRENLQQLAVPLSGLSELQAQAQEHMAAPTHLPLPVLTGITPAGLNASSEGDIEIFHDWIHSLQEAFFRENLDRALHILMFNRWGEIDEDIVADFTPLKQIDSEAESRIRKTTAEAGIGYIDAGVISPLEERQRLALDKESGYINLDANALPEPPDLEGEGEQSEGEAGLGDDEPEAAADAAAWSEGDHPRDNAGKFGSGGGGGSSSSEGASLPPAKFSREPNGEFQAVFKFEAGEGGLNVSDTGMVRSAYLPESERGKGLGKQMYIAAQKQLQKHGVTLRSSAVDMTESAVKLWEGMVKQGIAEKVGKGYRMLPIE